jgi:hypothetical protein
MGASRVDSGIELTIRPVTRNLWPALGGVIELVDAAAS